MCRISTDRPITGHMTLTIFPNQRSERPQGTDIAGMKRKQSLPIPAHSHLMKRLIRWICASRLHEYTNSSLLPYYWSLPRDCVSRDKEAHREMTDETCLSDLDSQLCAGGGGSSTFEATMLAWRHMTSDILLSGSEKLYKPFVLSQLFVCISSSIPLPLNRQGLTSSHLITQRSWI